MKRNSPPAGKGPHRDSAREQCWRNLLKQFAASGQNVRKFCAARQLKETAFYFWRAEIQRRDGQAPARRQRSTPSGPAFARVLVQPPILAAAEQNLRLRLDGGRELLLPASWPVDQVAALLRAIEGQPSIIEGAA
jgi:hypothetical protein